MAVSKLWPVTVRLATVLDYASNPEKTTKSKSKYSDADYQALRDVVAYAKDGEKTERELFCEGIHCNPQTAREQFITVKEQFDKPDGIQAYHGYLSFGETDITPELAQQVGMAFAERMWGDRFQVLVTTHLNTEHLHCHFVVNSVSFRDGKRLQNKEKAWWYFRHIADEVCLEHGLSVVQNPEAYQSPRILTQKDKAGMPTRYNLARAALDEAIAMSHNLRQLEYHLSEMGYTLGSNPKRKYWTIKGKGDERPIRLHRHTPKSALHSGSLKTVITSTSSRFSLKPTDRSNTGSEHGATELEKSAVCMGCTFTTATGSAICRSTRQDNRITHEFTIFSKRI